MKNLSIEGTKGIFFTPSVQFDAQTGVCELAGESYLEDTVAFYNPLLQWLEQYTKEITKNIVFSFKLTYFNTSSSKAIVDIVKILKQYQNEGGKVEINWYYPEDNYDILAEAEDIMSYLKIHINLIPYELNY
ncbi:MAG: DUF1987 domain-containing protein [Cytophagales bacterium]|nr:MAG: DUF1987 domain-containing protein [Cytophagales bacterium]